MDKKRPGGNKTTRTTETAPSKLSADVMVETDNKADIGMHKAEDIKPEVTTTPKTPETTAEPSSIEQVKKRIQQMTQDIDEAEYPTSPAVHDTVLNERNDVMQVINELEDQLDRQQEIREAIERELTQTNDKLQTANQRCQELEWQAVTFQTRVETLEQVGQEVTMLEEEVANANSRLQRVNEGYSGLEKERNRLRNELKASNKQLEELWAVRKERDGLRTDVRDLSGKIEEVERSRRDAHEERGQIQARYQETLGTLEETRAERHQQQMMLKAAEDRVHGLSRAQDELGDKLDTVRNEKKVLQAQLTHLERDNARLVEQRQFYETELASLRNMNRNAETALASVKKAFAEVRVALTETKTRARRRMIETWPRIGIPLRGIEDANVALQPTGVETSGINEPIGMRIDAPEPIPTIDGGSGTTDPTQP